MTYYHDLITQKSWQVLKELSKSYKFILIGGWAVYLYTKALKSKDIDLIMEFEALSKLKLKLDVTKNERLKKYEARLGEVEIDIYAPFYSDPGLRAEEVGKWTTNIEGFTVPKPEILMILKQKAYAARKNSSKGRKDLLDILSFFLKTDFDWDLYSDLVLKYKKQEFLRELRETLKNTFEIKELNLNRHTFSRLKKAWLKKLR